MARSLPAPRASSVDRNQLFTVAAAERGVALVSPRTIGANLAQPDPESAARAVRGAHGDRQRDQLFTVEGQNLLPASNDRLQVGQVAPVPAARAMGSVAGTSSRASCGQNRRPRRVVAVARRANQRWPGWGTWIARPRSALALWAAGSRPWTASANEGAGGWRTQSAPRPEGHHDEQGDLDGLHRPGSSNLAKRTAGEKSAGTAEVRAAAATCPSFCASRSSAPAAERQLQDGLVHGLLDGVLDDVVGGVGRVGGQPPLGDLGLRRRTVRRR